MTVEKQVDALKLDFSSYNQLKPDISNKFANKITILLFTSTIIFFGSLFQHSLVTQDNFYKYMHITNSLHDQTVLTEESIAYNSDKEGHFYIDSEQQIKNFKRYVESSKKNKSLNIYDPNFKRIFDNEIIFSDSQLSDEIIEIMQKEGMYVDIIKYLLHPKTDNNNHKYLPERQIMLAMQKLFALSDNDLDLTSFSLLNEVIDNSMTSEDMKQQYAALGIKYIEKQVISIKDKYNSQQSKSLVNKLKLVKPTILSDLLKIDYYNNYSKYTKILEAKPSTIHKDWNVFINKIDNTML